MAMHTCKLNMHLLTGLVNIYSDNKSTSTNVRNQPHTSSSLIFHPGTFFPQAPWPMVSLAFFLFFLCCMLHVGHASAPCFFTLLLALASCFWALLLGSWQLNLVSCMHACLLLCMHVCMYVFLYVCTRSQNCKPAQEDQAKQDMQQSKPGQASKQASKQRQSQHH